MSWGIWGVRYKNQNRLIGITPRTADVKESKLFSLTTNIDNFTGTAANNTFAGVTGDTTGGQVTSTLNTGDVLNGGGGVNTFNITGAGNAGPAIPLVETTNIQNVFVRSVDATTVNQTLMSGVVNAASNGSIASTTFTGADLASTYWIINSVNTPDGNANLTVNYANAAGKADTALLSVQNAGGKVGTTDVTQTIATTAATGDIEAVVLATTGTNRVALGGGSKVAEFTVTGDGTNTITLDAAATTMTVDASESTGTNTLIVGSLLGTGDTILGGTGTDTLRGTISTATQMIPTVTGVETLDLTFSAAGIFNASKVTGATKAILTPTAATTLTNLSGDVVELQVGKTAAITGSSMSVGYVTGSNSDVTLTLGATPTSGTAAVSVGATTFTNNAGGLTINSAGSASNSIGALTAYKASSVTYAGVSQALTGTTVLATAASDVSVDGTLKNTTITNLTVDNSLATLNVTSGAGTATIGNTTQTAASKTSIDTEYNYTGGAKALTAGDVTASVSADAGNTVDAIVNITAAAGAVSVGSLSFAGSGAATADTTTVALTATGTESTGTVTVADLIVDEGTDGTSATTVELLGNGGAITMTDLTLTDSDINSITLDAASSNVTLTTLANTISTTTDLVVSAASTRTAAITNLTGTGNLNSITASGAGTINLFTGTSQAVTGDASIDATGTTGDFTLGLGSAAGNLNVLLGNAASGKDNTVSTGAGNDVILGGTGVDSVIAGTGADIIDGAAGNDYLEGSAGADTLTGGTGVDTFGYNAVVGSSSDSNSSVKDTITDLATTDFIFLNLTNVNDFVVASDVTGSTNSYNASTNGDGTLTDVGDVIIATTGITLTSAQAQAMTIIDAVGTGAADIITGGANNDTIEGAAAADDMTGGGGVDTFVTGEAGDSIVASAVGLNGATLAANDTLTFNTTSTNNVDLITDFGATDLLDTTATAGTAPTSLIGNTMAAALTDGVAYVVYGTYVAGSGIFTVATTFNAATAADALVVVGNGTLTGTSTTGYVVLDNLSEALSGANFV